METGIEIAGNPTLLVENLLVEVVGLLLRLAATIDDKLTVRGGKLPDNSARQ